MTHSSIYLKKATNWAEFLEDSATRRSGSSFEKVRSNLAFSIGVPPSIFRELKLGRRKTIEVTIYERIRTAVVKELRSEMQKFEAMLSDAMESGVDCNQDEIQEAQQLLEKARSLLTGEAVG